MRGFQTDDIVLSAFLSERAFFCRSTAVIKNALDKVVTLAFEIQNAKTQDLPRNDGSKGFCLRVCQGFRTI
jgi:hypothetical protein